MSLILYLGTPLKVLSLWDDFGLNFNIVLWYCKVGDVRVSFSYAGLSGEGSSPGPAETVSWSKFPMSLLLSESIYRSLTSHFQCVLSQL